MSDSMNPHSFTAVRDELARRLGEPVTHRVQLLAGPRQVGKTTLLLELAGHWGDRAIYAAADAPGAALPGWWDNLWQQAARLTQGGPGALLLDEIQYLPDWSRLLKAQVDRCRRERLALHVVASGSSALSLGRGTRETMAGRFERLRLLHWPAVELANRFALTEAEAVRRVIAFGSYPGAVSLWGEPARWRAYVRDSIVEPAIGRDVLAIEAIRKPALLRQVFAVCAGQPAEICSLQKISGQLGAGSALETVAHYLHLLEEACLVAALPKYSGRVARQRAAPPKLVVLNNALLAATAPGDAPAPNHDPQRWGRWVENACAAFAWNCGQTLCYWREEPLEVDLVTDGSWGQWAIEVKTGDYSVSELSGLSEFCRRYPRFRPLVVSDPGQESVAHMADLPAISWEKFLLRGAPLSSSTRTG